MNVWVFRGVVLAALLSAGWAGGRAIQRGRTPEWGPRNGRIRVLTTIFPLYDFARSLGGDAVDVRNLLPPGVDPHEYALSPRDVALVANSDLLIMNGGLDEFLRDALARSGVTHTVVECSQAIPQSEWLNRDPHLWLDPRFAASYAQTIARGIQDLMPEAKVGPYVARGADLQKTLAEIDEQLTAGLAGVRGRSFVTFHNAFGYLARRYGLNVAGVWQRSAGREPSPRDVESLLSAARSQNARAIFTEPGFSPRAVEMVASDSKLPIFELDPAETAEYFDRTSYVEIMRKNLQTLQRALR